MTPAEWSRHVEGTDWRREQDARRDVSLAWMTANFTRAERLKPLEDILDPVEAVILTPEEDARQQRMMAEASEAIKRRREQKQKERQ